MIDAYILVRTKFDLIFVKRSGAKQRKAKLLLVEPHESSIYDIDQLNGDIKSN